MAKTMVFKVKTRLASTDYDAQVTAAGPTINAETLDVTNMNSAGWREFIYGLRSATVTLNFGTRRSVRPTRNSPSRS